MSIDSVRRWLAAHAPELELIEVRESTATVETAARALGVESARIAKTLAFVESLSAAQIDGSEERRIVTQAGTPKEKIFSGQSYLLNYGLPHFFFHATTAYAILRHSGVEVGKKDYIGSD